MKELEKFNTKRFMQRILGRGGILSSLSHVTYERRQDGFISKMAELNKRSLKQNELLKAIGQNKEDLACKLDDCQHINVGAKPANAPRRARAGAAGRHHQPQRKRQQRARAREGAATASSSSRRRSRTSTLLPASVRQPRLPGAAQRAAQDPAVASGGAAHQGRGESPHLDHAAAQEAPGVSAGAAAGDAEAAAAARAPCAVRQQRGRVLAHRQAEDGPRGRRHAQNRGGSMAVAMCITNLYADDSNRDIDIDGVLTAITGAKRQLGILVRLTLTLFIVRRQDEFK